MLMQPAQTETLGSGTISERPSCSGSRRCGAGGSSSNRTTSSSTTPSSISSSTGTSAAMTRLNVAAKPFVPAFQTCASPGGFLSPSPTLGKSELQLSPFSGTYTGVPPPTPSPRGSTMTASGGPGAVPYFDGGTMLITGGSGTITAETIDFSACNPKTVSSARLMGQPYAQVGARASGEDAAGATTSSTTTTSATSRRFHLHATSVGADGPECESKANYSGSYRSNYLIQQEVHLHDGQDNAPSYEGMTRTMERAAATAGAHADCGGGRGGGDDAGSSQYAGKGNGNRKQSAFGFGSQQKSARIKKNRGNRNDRVGSASSWLSSFSPPLPDPREQTLVLFSCSSTTTTSSAAYNYPRPQAQLSSYGGGTNYSSASTPGSAAETMGNLLRTANRKDYTKQALASGAAGAASSAPTPTATLTSSRHGTSKSNKTQLHSSWSPCSTTPGGGGYKHRQHQQFQNSPDATPSGNQLSRHDRHPPPPPPPPPARVSPCSLATTAATPTSAQGHLLPSPPPAPPGKMRASAPAAAVSLSSSSRQPESEKVDSKGEHLLETGWSFWWGRKPNKPHLRSNVPAGPPVPPAAAGAVVQEDQVGVGNTAAIASPKAVHDAEEETQRRDSEPVNVNAEAEATSANLATTATGGVLPDDDNHNSAAATRPGPAAVGAGPSRPTAVQISPLHDPTVATSSASLKEGDEKMEPRCTAEKMELDENDDNNDGDCVEHPGRLSVAGSNQGDDEEDAREVSPSAAGRASSSTMGGIQATRDIDVQNCKGATTSSYNSWTSPSTSTKPELSAKQLENRDKSYLDKLVVLGSFRTIEDFARYYCYLKAPTELSKDRMIACLREGCRPAWEDYPDGGCWLIRIDRLYGEKKLNRMWEAILVALISEEFGTPNVLGVALSIRMKADVLQLWLRDSRGKDAVGERLREVLDLNESCLLEYKEHCLSMQDKSTFTNAKNYMFLQTFQ